jgi:hypothetical protein
VSGFRWTLEREREAMRRLRRSPPWTIFRTLYVETWITVRFLAAMLSEVDIFREPGYGEAAFRGRYGLRYIESNGRLYRQRVGAAGGVVHHEEIGGLL